MGRYKEQEKVRPWRFIQEPAIRALHRRYSMGAYRFRQVSLLSSKRSNASGLRAKDGPSRCIHTNKKDTIEPTDKRRMPTGFGEVRAPESSARNLDNGCLEVARDETRAG